MYPSGHSRIAASGGSEPPLERNYKCQTLASSPTARTASRPLGGSTVPGQPFRPPGVSAVKTGRGRRRRWRIPRGGARSYCDPYRGAPLLWPAVTEHLFDSSHDRCDSGGSLVRVAGSSRYLTRLLLIQLVRLPGVPRCLLIGRPVVDGTQSADAGGLAGDARGVLLRTA